MSFPEIENQLRSIKQEIHEINQTIKGLVIQMQLVIGMFEGTLKSRETPLDKTPNKSTPRKR